MATRRGTHGYQTRLAERRHNKQLHDWLDGNHSDLLQRSLLGLTRTYNGLPQAAVDEPTVSDFQRHLQKLVKQRVQEGDDHWRVLLSARKRLASD